MPDKIPFSEFTFRGSTYVLKDAVARAAIDQLNSFEYVVCTSAEDTPINITWGNVTGALLPDVDTTHRIYLVLSTNGTNDTYDEYLTIQNGNEFSWEKIGNTDVDLTGYVVKDNAVVTSSLSMGRLAGSTVGVGSTALGQDLIASGMAAHAEGAGKTGTHNIIVNGSTQPDITYGAIGAAAHAEGNQTTAYGANSHAEGYYSIASGSDSHAEGSSTVASAMAAHAEGNATKAYAKASHAEGTNSTANGEHSHAEGYSTVANGNYSHTEGYKSNASGTASHAEGNQTVATGLYSHTEGSLSKADGPSAHAEGTSTIANENSSHAEGSATKAFGVQAHTEGYRTQAMKQAAHAEGAATLAIGMYSHAEGYGVYSIGSHLTAEKNSTTGTVTSPLSNPIHEDQILVLDNGFYATITAISEGRLSFTIDTAFDDDYSDVSFVVYAGRASGSYSHVEGQSTVASGTGSHAEGNSTIASGGISHAEGNGTKASSSYAHSEGYLTEASNTAAHAEGSNNLASGYAGHAEGFKTTSSGTISHAEGYQTTASGYGAHVEGYQSISSSYYSHAEGYQSISSGYYAHSEGAFTEASGAYSHAAGRRTIANGMYMNAIGKYNIADTPFPDWEANHQYEIGDRVVISNGGGRICNTANNDAEYDPSKWDVFPMSTVEGTLFVVGNGEDDENRSNAFRTDIGGNGYFAGDVYTEYNLETGIGKKLATSDDIPIESGSGIGSIRQKTYEHGIATYTQNASGTGAIAFGMSTIASGTGAIAEGRETISKGIASHTEGYYSYTFSNGSHTEGNSRLATGNFSHAEGGSTRRKYTNGGQLLWANANEYTCVFYSSIGGIPTIPTGIEVGQTIVVENDNGATVTTIIDIDTNTNVVTVDRPFATTYNECPFMAFGTEVAGQYSHAEGYDTETKANVAHAEGYKTLASGYASHSAGLNTIANGMFMSAIGKYNVPDTSYNAWEANHQYEVGDRVVYNGVGKVCIEANNDATYRSSKWQTVYQSTQQGTLLVIGNGEENNRSNAFRVDMSGDARFAGDVYVGCNPDSTGGAKLATINDLPEAPVQDVQVNGASVLDQNGVANVPVADSNIAGVIKADSYYGAYVNANGKLQINPSELAMIPAGTNAYRPIVPSTQHAAAFYGLAKAAGDITQSQSNNSVGTYTLEAKAAIQAMLGIETGTEVVRLI